MSDSILIIDGHSIINRAFYGLGPNTRLTAPDGTPSGAVMTFFNIFLKHYEKLQPDRVLIAFDRSEPTFRHEQYEDYKAGRHETPEALNLQIPMLKNCLTALQLPQTEAAGWEADDLIGTAAAEAEAAKAEEANAEEAAVSEETKQDSKKDKKGRTCRKKN